MKTILFCLALWSFLGVVSAVYVDIQDYRFRKQCHLPKLGLKSVWLFLIIWTVCHLLVVLLWPLNLIFYKHHQQEELNDARGTQDGAGLL